MKKNIGNTLALYPTLLVVVGAMVNGKPNWLLVGHLGIMGHDHVMVSLAKPHYTVMSRVMRKIDFGIWQKSITGGGLTALWLLFSRQGAKGQGRRYAARLALDAL